MPEKLLKVVMKKLNISKRDTIVKGGRYHNFKDLMKFPSIGPPDFYYSPLPQLIHKDLPINDSIFNVIRKKDVMLLFPYHSFQHVIDFLREASIDPKVKEIKITLYRVATNSNVINALINAAQNGKAVTVFLELQARFDEQANIYWTERLQEAGVEIIKSIPGFKVHSKVLLIRRYENKKYVDYANISTGNFNEETAKVYTDFSLFTSEKKITTEIEKLFSLFRANYKPQHFNTLIVSPFTTRNFIMRMLNKEINNAKEGKAAWVIVKINNLADDKIVRKLYQASQAGVKIKLIIRSMCVLVPGVTGLSENIEAISIVDHFLEHSRVFVFANAGKPKYFISSADWMLRNLDHRIEVSIPIWDENIKTMIQHYLDIQFMDNLKARLITADGRHIYKTIAEDEKAIRSQTAVYEYLCNLND
jgi:polyphosphate kinase